MTAVADDSVPEQAKMTHRRRSDDNARLPREVRTIFAVLAALGIGGGGAVGLINWPWENKIDAKAEHEKLQSQIDDLKDLPARTADNVIEKLEERFIIRRPK